MQKQLLSGCTRQHNSKETELGSSNHDASLSAGENTGVVLVPCCTWKCVPAGIYVCVDIFKVCHLLWQMSLQ